MPAVSVTAAATLGAAGPNLLSAAGAVQYVDINNWTGVAGTGTAVADPLGGNTASQFGPCPNDALNRPLRLQPGPLLSAATLVDGQYRTSCWLRSPDGNPMTVRLGMEVLNGNAPGAYNQVTVTGTWQRFVTSQSVIKGGATGVNVLIYSLAGEAAGRSLQVWRPQVERAAAVSPWGPPLSPSPKPSAIPFTANVNVGLDSVGKNLLHVPPLGNSWDNLYGYFPAGSLYRETYGGNILGASVSAANNAIADGSTWTQVAVTALGSGYRYFFPGQRLVAGGVYTFSYEIMLPASASAAVRVSLDLNDQSTTTYTLQPGERRRVSVTTTLAAAGLRVGTPPGSTYHFCDIVTTDGPATFLLRRPQLEAGAVASSWEPAVEPMTRNVAVSRKSAAAVTAAATLAASVTAAGQRLTAVTASMLVRAQVAASSVRSFVASSRAMLRASVAARPNPRPVVAPVVTTVTGSATARSTRTANVTAVMHVGQAVVAYRLRDLQVQVSLAPPRWTAGFLDDARWTTQLVDDRWVVVLR